MVLALFLVVFIVGPGVFRLLMRAEPSRSVLGWLTLFTASFVVISIVLRYGVAAGWGANVWLAALSLGAIWFGWIGVLAMGAQALRRADPGPVMRR